MPRTGSAARAASGASAGADTSASTASGPPRGRRGQAMTPRAATRSGPSVEELKLRAEVDRLRRQLAKLKKAGAAAAAGAVEPAAGPAAESAAAGESSHIAELTATRTR